MRLLAFDPRCDRAGALVLLSLGLWLGSASTPLQAQQGGDANGDTAYREVIDLALRELELGNYREAYAQFERAHRMQPSARTLRGLGLVSFELRQYVEAAGHLEGALTSDQKPLAGRLRSETEALLERTRSYIGTLSLEVSPPDATVLVDKQVAALTPEGVLPLNVGRHLIELRADGYRSEERNVRIRGGQRQTLRVALGQLASAAPAQPDTAALTATTPVRSPQPRDENASVFEGPWLWTAVGVVVVGASVGAFFAFSDTEEKPEDVYGGSAGASLRGP